MQSVYWVHSYAPANHDSQVYQLERILRIQIEEKIGDYHLEITFDHNYLLY